jgi:hypothetical protein
VEARLALVHQTPRTIATPVVSGVHVFMHGWKSPGRPVVRSHCGGLNAATVSVSGDPSRDLQTPLRPRAPVFIEPEDRNDLLHSEVARFDFTPLEEKATSLREVLLEKGWTEIQ